MTNQYVDGDFANPAAVCDVIMKGGITSGVVYPLALTELARQFRFSQVGGTSAGAIAASAAAAAEYGRHAPGGGFVLLAKLPAEVGKILFSLFQPIPALKPVFENVAMAKVGTSAEECRDLGYFRREDRYSMNTQRLVADAKETALGLARSGWKPAAASWQEGAQTTQIKVLGEQFLSGAKLAIHMLLRGGYASEYDATVARKLANILAGGPLTASQMVSEQYVLDLEREAFVSLCGEKKTQERMAHTLKTGKPLRN